ncbi:MAG TPA: CDP-glycerol glycerophosphotransferase family protein [Rhabdochlamydiaceae bacterium]|jgi:hypothetical protein
MPTFPACAGLIYGNESHHLDHIAPLCALLQMPLIVTEERLALLAKKFYPMVEVVAADYLAIGEYLVSHFNLIFYSIPRDLFDELFFLPQQLLQKKVHTIWCPHGNSDKGHSLFFMEALQKEEMALLYGKQMIDFLQKKSAFQQLKEHVIVGNFRYEFYLKNKEFYDSLVEREITRRLAPAKKIYLYAPTWQDFEKSGSFFDALPHLAENIPPDVNLLVKLHPNLLQQHDWQVEDLVQHYQSQDHILFITDFSPIYPLLSSADVYIGDMSSMGYDFLTFDRPLFFLNQNTRDPLRDPGLYLFRTGIEIKREAYAKIYDTIDHFFQFELRPFSPIRKEVYAYAFGHRKSLEEIKNEIETIVHRYVQSVSL